MPNIENSLNDLRFLERLAEKNTFIHRIHPLIKFVTTLLFLTVVVSFGRYEVGQIMPMFFYLVIVFSLSEIPVKPILKRLIFIEPLIIGIGILNPLFDNGIIQIGTISVSRGWVTFLSIFIKGSLTITAGLLLIATTGMESLAMALRMMKVPKIMVMQLLLTYRYISVLMEEVARTLRAYSLRAPNQRGIRINAWGSLVGHLILRTFDRGQRVYEAMCLRGFAGEYVTGQSKRINVCDLMYFAIWLVFFFVVRNYNLPRILEQLIDSIG